MEDSFGDKNEEVDDMKPDKIIEEIDKQVKIKKLVNFGDVAQDYDQILKENNNNVLNSNENIIFAFSLDPYQLIVFFNNYLLGCCKEYRG